MSIIEKNMKLIELYDIYQELLTEKQKVYFESYYFEDYSISEISENENVSRNAVHDQIKRTESKLLSFELKLQLAEKKKIRNKLFNQVINLTEDKKVLLLVEDLKKVE